MYEYPITAHQEADHYWSSCTDIPEAHSTGDSLEELLKNAVAGITLALTIYVDQGREIPAASDPAEDQHPIALPAVTVAKIALWNAMRAQGLKVADLARKLGVSHPVANRLVDFEHNSKIEQVEGALAALGQTVKAATRNPGWIPLPYGGAEAGFYARRLVDAFRELDKGEIVIGAVASKLDGVKPHSLDYLLRSRYARNCDTKQAVQAVVDDLVATGLFARSRMDDPQTGREVDSIKLV
ncbi:hypothetical protein PMM47T1_13930 [Pseudomonas sp. M47T1]|uniref:type II toxin-antitoxin system HicB family antitoxin n=1 Tax=Pseudomonas sp. M47T1 TaxID=1179778 RepID=UPI00026085F5|nr:hypothetical protein PMM47T1_13930 [Pseudomonas sp. M47T1]